MSPAHINGAASAFVYASGIGTQKRSSAVVSSAYPPSRVYPVNCGSLHRFARPALQYSQMPQVRLVGLYDLNTETASDVAGEYGTEPYSSLEELADHVSAVSTSICPIGLPLGLRDSCIDENGQRFLTTLKRNPIN